MKRPNTAPSRRRPNRKTSPSSFQKAQVAHRRSRSNRTVHTRNGATQPLRRLPLLLPSPPSPRSAPTTSPPPPTGEEVFLRRGGRLRSPFSLGFLGDSGWVLPWSHISTQVGRWRRPSSTAKAGSSSSWTPRGSRRRRSASSPSTSVRPPPHLHPFLPLSRIPHCIAWRACSCAFVCVRVCSRVRVAVLVLPRLSISRCSTCSSMLDSRWSKRDLALVRFHFFFVGFDSACEQRLDSLWCACWVASSFPPNFVRSGHKLASSRDEFVLEFSPLHNWSLFLGYFLLIGVWIATSLAMRGSIRIYPHF